VGTTQRVVLAAAMPERVLLHAAAALVELMVRELHEMERIRDLGRVGESGGVRWRMIALTV
jgi:hypothetical protein